MKKLVPKGTDAKSFLKPLNYEEIFAPKTAAELRKLVGGEEPVGSEEDDVPLESGAEESDGTDETEETEETEETASIDDLL